MTAIAATTRSFWAIEYAEVEELLRGWGEPAYRARQVWHHAYRDLAESFAGATDLPLALRQRLDREFSLIRLEPLSRQASVDGSTHKLLSRLADGLTIETVLMLYPAGGQGRRRATICVSSQAGCAMGCVFCATGQQGFLRNLEAGEIVEQIITFARELAADGERVTNVVFMGMGEPLHNYENTLAAVRRINDSFGLGARHMTLSTVGLAPGILRLARERLQVGLAVSLHAPDDELRRRLIPVARRYSLDEILSACAEYHLTGRRVSFEYCLMADVNDSPAQAHALARRLRPLAAHVNLIPLNPTGDSGLHRPSRERTLAFQRAIKSKGVACTVRVEKGIEIAAACGQLRGRQLSDARQHSEPGAPASGQP